MTDLTKKWKKGELPNGWYWCKCYNEEIKLLYYGGDGFELDDPETKNYYFFLPKDIEELTILAPASYEEWQAKLEQNAQLKELLKECREYVKKDYGNYLTYTQSVIYQEINQALGEDK